MKKGFTLIELLVVIAIIGMLSSVVLASLNNARNKAKDSAIKESVNQMASLMALNFSDYGDYCNLQAGWNNITPSAVCSVAFSGTYASKAQSICSNIFTNAGENGWALPGNYKMYTGTGLGCATTYSIMIYLNDGKWLCSGSSGVTAEYPAYSNYPDGHDIGVTPGCYQQP